MQSYLLATFFFFSFICTERIYDIILSVCLRSFANYDHFPLSSPQSKWDILLYISAMN